MWVTLKQKSKTTSDLLYWKVQKCLLLKSIFRLALERYIWGGGRGILAASIHLYLGQLSQPPPLPSSWISQAQEYRWDKNHRKISILYSAPAVKYFYTCHLTRLKIGLFQLFTKFILALPFYLFYTNSQKYSEKIPWRVFSLKRLKA